MRIAAWVIAAGVAFAGCGGGMHGRHSDTQASVNGRALACSQYISAEPPPANYEVVLGVVALPMTALQTARSDLPDPADRLFAKAGLLIRAGSTSSLVVPGASAGRPSIGWGSPAPRSHEVIVNRCPRDPAGGSGWLSYPGGFWVSHPSCISLLVESGGRERRVPIGVGAPCPGQKPPPEPTQS